MIIDIRNYPSEFVPFALGSLFVDQPTPFARFTAGDLDNPGAFLWRGRPLSLTPQQPHYPGKVVVLVDEVSLSQAEYTTMAFRASPRTVVVGSTTAGADGNVSQIPLPGGLRTAISGIGVFYPDKRPTQRIGIVPDVEVAADDRRDPRRTRRGARGRTATDPGARRAGRSDSRRWPRLALRSCGVEPTMAWDASS